jgi:hypothetical protein
MAKKIKFNQSIIHNVYLLYFLFIATLLHLGYFLVTKETLLLACFSLAVIFVYLVNPNMIIVLGVSILFVDLLYLVRKVPEGFTNASKNKTDASGNETDASGNEICRDVSGNIISCDKDEGFETQEDSEKKPNKFVDSDGNPLTLTNLFNKVKEMHNTDKLDGDLRDSVNTMVGVSGVLKEKMSETPLEEVDKESANVKTLINTVKEISPDLNESLKALNSIDINELNKLINSLNSMTKNINHNVG